MSTSSNAEAVSRKVGLQRLERHTVDRADLNFLHYYYLTPCIARAGERSSGRLLDIGCGNKPYRPLFANVTEYLGCDAIQSSLALVDVICLADSIPLPDQSFDHVLCTQTIEHVANHNGLLAEAFRLLKPGGTLFLSGPMCWQHHEVPYDFFRFTEYGFRYIVENAGFTVDQVEANGGKWSVLGLTAMHTLPTRIVRKPFFTKALNRFFLYMDKRYYDTINTSNFFVTAHRPA